MHAFEPTAETKRDLRNALGLFGTGVTIVTTAVEGKPVGITVNSFTSVSLDPALVLWAPAKASLRFATFETAPHYAIHVLEHSQTDLASLFARNAEDFSTCDWQMNEHGVPVIGKAVARFECERLSSHDGGDHAIVVGRVLRAINFGGDPLMFVSGEFGRFQGAA
ncbi:MAG: flavin reductase (DIM6/NTAB) family NADH-FMN oxidoreductase RutF [Porticoccaceae bacterium]|jgi:flavin reductase (DIM6/NTAB) family NADH-FMN oxidoreductase RutF